jgi:hypothetical protein
MANPKLIETTAAAAKQQVATNRYLKDNSHHR